MTLYEVKVEGGGTFTYDTVDVGRFALAMAESKDPRPFTVKPITEVDWKALDPERKVEIIEAMGFTRITEDHHPDCLARLDPGFVCNCVPDPDYFTPPEDVAKHWGQTWEQRRVKSR